MTDDVRDDSLSWLWTDKESSDEARSTDMQSDSKRAKRDVYDDSLSWLCANEESSDEAAVDDDRSSCSGLYFCV